MQHFSFLKLRSRPIGAAFFALFVLTTLLPAQSGAPPVNVASFANPDLPNGKIAQGSMFEIFGSAIAANGINLATEFPLPTVLAGSSVQVTVGGQQIDCIIVRTLNTGRVAAILPSNTPVGAGTLVVRFNGASTTPSPIEVVPHSFGAFTLNSAGSGPSVMTDANSFAVNTILAPFTNGAIVDIWGTGVGAAPFSDAGAPQVIDLGYDVQVTVGGQNAQVFYAGRSGCCSGVDIVRFQVPANVSGCHVPVLVTVDGVPSNSTSMSISADGSVCSDPGGLSSSTITQAQTTGGATIGYMGLNRISISVDISGVGQTFEVNTDTATASFQRFNLDQLIRFQGLANFTSIGSCQVFQFSGNTAAANDPILGQVAGIDVGSVSVTGPRGTQDLTRSAPGQYNKVFSSGLPDIPGFPALALIDELITKGQFGGGGTSFLGAGDYTFNISGMSGVGPGNASISVPARPQTNVSSIASVDRSRPLRVTYTPTPAADFVRITGASITNAASNPTGAFFYCHASAAAGFYDVPSSVLSLLPVSESIQGNSTGTIGIGVGSVKEVSIPGLDQAFVTQLDTEQGFTGYF